MLSRHNIRVKIMQLLYAQNRDAGLKSNVLETKYFQNVNNTFKLYLFHLLSLIKVAEYVKKVVEINSQKLRPTEKDKQFAPKLFFNPLMESLVNQKDLQQTFKKNNINLDIDLEGIRKLYTGFAATEDYENYLANPSSSNEDHLQILLSLYKYLIGQEYFIESIEDKFINWEDDKSLIIGAMKKTIKALPATSNVADEFLPPDDTVKEFGAELLYKVNHFDSELMEAINPVLTNWKADRLAILDTIMLKMAIVELLHFPTIPTKVTLNEYVDVAKKYSTPKSKEFINGVLDKLMKQFEEEGKIIKEGRGLEG